MKYLFSFCSWSNLWIKTNLLTKGIKFFIKNETYRIIKVLTFPKYAYVRNWPYGWIGPCKNFFFLENSCTHMGLSYMPVWRCLVTGQKLKTPLWKSLGVKKGASDNTISFFYQSFRFSVLWLILARDLGRSGQNKSWRTEREQKIIFLKLWTVVSFCEVSWFFWAGCSVDKV